MSKRQWGLRWGAIAAAIGLIGLAGMTAGARAETIRIVALGASNTGGSGVSSSQAWPAQLERMLRAKGYDVSVSVHSVTGDTSAGILSRVDSAVTEGTRVVVFDIGRGNDRDRGQDSKGSKAQIAQRIRAHGAKPVFAAYARIVGSEQAHPAAWQTNDIHHHLTAQSHARVAAALLPQVMAAIGKRH